VLNSPAVAALMPTSDDFDRHTPDRVVPLVAYLASHLCHFTGRVFAIEGSDVAIYGPAVIRVGDFGEETPICYVLTNIRKDMNDIYGTETE